MDYKEKYEQGLECIQEILSSGEEKIKMTLLKKRLQPFFPELGESEDELTWLTKFIEEEAYSLSMDIRDNEDRIKLKNLQRSLAWLEKQGEQKLVDKVEPKFHEGDWIISKYMHLVMQIINNDIGYYKTVETDGTERYDSYDFIERNFKLWSIQDAKDGDVLAAQECYVIFKEIDGLNIKCHCTYHYMGFNPSFHINTLQNKTAFHPATKEERDLLFQKMKEEGYEWNDDKKELKMITTPQPKFKVGDWIIRSAEGFKHNTYLITEVKDYYVCEELKGRRVTFTFNDVHKNFKLWDISDAKDGDVLVDKYNNIGIFQERKGMLWNSYVYLGCNSKLSDFNIGGSIGGSHEQTDTHPATKEQRDTLFKAMNEAGHQWDGEKVVKNGAYYRMVFKNQGIESTEDTYLKSNKITCDDAQCYKGKSASEAGDNVTLEEKS